MFGLGKAKKYHSDVWEILNCSGIKQHIPPMMPAMSEIEKARLYKYSPHGAALLMGYTLVLNYFSLKKVEQAQSLYDQVRDYQDLWGAKGLISLEDAKAFNGHISSNSTVKTR